MVAMGKGLQTLEISFRSQMWRGVFLGLLLICTTGLAASALQLTEQLGEMNLTIQGAVKTAWANFGSHWHVLETWLPALANGRAEQRDLEELRVPGELTLSSDRAEPNVAVKETVDQSFRVPQDISLTDKNNLKPLVIQAGSTVSEILLQVYGTQSPLALDIVKEFNSHIQNINQVRIGEKLWLPPLTLETLLRKQSDGSYRLILASFSSSSAAEAFVQEIVQHHVAGVVITPHLIEANILLYRVEVEELKDLEAVRQAWAIASVSDRRLPLL
jgi:hypothetical protein